MKRINSGLTEFRSVITQVPEIAFHIVSDAHNEFYPEWLKYDYRQNKEPSSGKPTPKGLLKVSRLIQYSPVPAIYTGTWEQYSRWLNRRHAMMEGILRVACGGFAVYHNGLYWPVTNPSLRHKHVPAGYQWWYRHSHQIAGDIATLRIAIINMKPPPLVLQATKELQQLVGPSHQTMTKRLTDAVIECFAHQQLTGSMLWLLLQFPEEEVAVITNVRRLCEDLATTVVLRMPQAPRPAVKEEKPDEDEAATNQGMVATTAAAVVTPQWQSQWDNWQGHSSWHSWHEQQKAVNWNEWQPGESSSSTWRSLH